MVSREERWTGAERDRMDVAKGIGVVLACLVADFDANAAEQTQPGETITVHGVPCVIVADSCIDPGVWSFFNSPDIRLAPPDIRPNPRPPPDTGPKKPTEQECRDAVQQCKNAANEENSNCLKQEGMSNINNINQGNLCFNVDREAMANRVGCSIGEVDDKSRWRYDSCHTRFRRAALLECAYGRPGMSVGVTHTSSAEVGIEGFGKLGGSTSVTLQVERPANQGSRDYCASRQTALKEACDREGDQCKARARGTALSVAIDPNRDISLLLGQIDRARLGFQNTSATGTRPPGAFRPLGRDEPRESRELYVERLSFLAAWSKFISQEGITVAQQRQAQQAFDNAQRAGSAAVDTRIKLWVEALILPVTVGRQDAKNVRDRILQFERGHELVRRWNAAEQALRPRLNASIGQQRTNRFFNEVWPGIAYFTFAGPMAPRQDVVAPSVPR